MTYLKYLVETLQVFKTFLSFACCPLLFCIDRLSSCFPIYTGVKDFTGELKERARHLPDGQTGSIVSITDNPPYRQMENQTEF